MGYRIEDFIHRAIALVKLLPAEEVSEGGEADARRLRQLLARDIPELEEALDYCAKLGKFRVDPIITNFFFGHVPVLHANTPMVMDFFIIP